MMVEIIQLQNNNKMKYPKDYGLDDIYKFYKDKCKSRNKKYIPRLMYSKILRYYNSELCKDIVYNSNEFRIPFRIGYLRIRKFKQNIILDENGQLKKSHLKPDWKKTKELWASNDKYRKEKKLIYHLNTKTNGYYYKWDWNRNYSDIKSINFYNLEMTRTNKRLIAKAVRENDKLDYYE